MKYSKEELTEAILTVAERFDKTVPITLLIYNVGVYSTIKELIYIMFVEKYEEYHENDNKVFQSINIIREYCQEMKEKGEVSFKQ